MKTLLLTLGFGLSLHAASLAASTTKPSDFDAAKPAQTEGSVIEASDKDALAANKDKDVTIEGKITSAKWSSSGKVMNAHFADSEVTVAAFQSAREKLDGQFSGDVAKALSGATVRIKGKLKDFKDKPEILINDGSQITIVDAGPTTGPATAPAR